MTPFPWLGKGEKTREGLRPSLLNTFLSPIVERGIKGVRLMEKLYSF
jgi:hypothetical protein